MNHILHLLGQSYLVQDILIECTVKLMCVFVLRLCIGALSLEQQVHHDLDGLSLTEMNSNWHSTVHHAMMYDINIV